MNDNRNLVLAVVLSAVVLFGWEYFVAITGVAGVICIPFSFLMQRFYKKDDHDA